MVIALCSMCNERLRHKLEDAKEHGMNDMQKLHVTRRLPQQPQRSHGTAPAGQLLRDLAAFSEDEGTTGQHSTGKSICKAPQPAVVTQLQRNPDAMREKPKSISAGCRSSSSTVSLVVHTSSKAPHVHVFQLLKEHFSVSSVSETAKQPELVPTFVSDEEQLQGKISALAENSGSSCFVVISDQFTQPANGQLTPSPLVERIRSELSEKNVHAGLIAIVSQKPHRTTDIDRVLDGRNLELKDLLGTILETAAGLKLKLPPDRQFQLGDEEAFLVRLAQTKKELLGCFRLRHEIYGLMGYLDDEILSSPSQIEIDSFDQLSLHFLATDKASDSIAGTLRLVLPRPSPILRNTVVGTPYDVYQMQAAWCQEIAREVPEDTFRKRLGHPYVGSLPIFQSFDFKKRWERVLLPPSSYAEVSRVVVSQKYRGAAISKLLIQTAIAAAIDIRLKFLLLECIPTHVPMYTKYGFVELGGGTHNRVQELDQIAVGMTLGLEPTPHNAAFQLGKRHIEAIRAGSPDPKMLFGTKHLCLCARRACWENAAYPFRSQQACPLSSRHANT